MTNFLVKTSGQKLKSDDSVKTLMCLHGWGMNSRVWEPIRKHLETHYHIIWVDLPGHGFNRNIKAESLENMVNLLESVTPSNIHILAWSLGGMVSQALAQRIPEKIKSITMVTSTLKFSQSDNQDWKHAMSDEILNRFADNLKQDTEKTLKRFIALQFIGVKHSKQVLQNLITHLFDDAFDGEKEIEKKGGGCI